MMNFKQAMNEFIKHSPDLTILRCIDYDSEHYVIEAVKDPNVTDYNSPYYGVDKNTGAISSFIPTFDLPAFFDAVRNRTVYCTYE